MTTRIIIDTHGPKKGGIELAFLAAKEICNSQSCNLVICAPTKETVAQTVLNEVIPSASISKMAKGEVFNFDGISVTLESQITLSPHKSTGVIIALYGSDRMMDKIDKIPVCEGVVFVPWTEAEGEAWRSKWNPIVLPESNESDPAAE